MKNPKRFHHYRGFTLIEILVVIAIIAGLAAVSTGVIISKVKQAKITEGSNVAREITLAFDVFEQKYGYPPYVDSDNSGIVELKTDSGKGVDFLKVLMGKEQTPTINPDNKEFFTAKTAKKDRSGIVWQADGVTPAALYDPFGNPYTIIINYDEKRVDLAGTDFSGHVDKNGPLIVNATHIAVGSPGPDKTFQSSSEDSEEDDVKSW